MKSWLNQFLDEEANIEYCPYCFHPRNSKRSCCGENHFMLFSELDIKDQMDIAHQEWEIHYKE